MLFGLTLNESKKLIRTQIKYGISEFQPTLLMNISCILWLKISVTKNNLNKLGKILNKI